MIKALAYLILFSAAGASAQTARGPTGDVALGASNIQAESLPPSTASTRIAMVVDSGAIGGCFDIVTSDANIAVTLILPNGTAVTAANASSLGFTLSAFTSDGSSDVPSFSMPGTHTLIEFTSAQATGNYQINADSSAVSAESALNVSYFPASSLGAAISVEERKYKVGETVVLAGLLFDGTKPVAGAAMTAVVATRFALGWRASVGGYTLVSQQRVSSTDSQYTYSAGLTNHGTAELGVIAGVTSSSAAVQVVSGTLVFGFVAANSTRVSANTFTIQQNSQAAFDPDALNWAATSAGTPAKIPLRDSGKYDYAPGDGIYTGSFVPRTAGEYTASLTATGTSRGVAFARTASTTFRVYEGFTTIGAFSDAPVDTDGNGLTDRIDVTVDVNVHTPGSYRFSMSLRSGKDDTVDERATMTLAAGPQRITLGFPAADLIRMGADGPYERVSALLRETGPDETVAAYLADGGPTQAYRLSSFDHGPIFFNGRNSAAGVAAEEGGTFDWLRIRLGVTLGPLPFGTSDWNCSWEGTLSDSTGAQIEFANWHTKYRAGFSSGDRAIILDFNGNRIARSGRNGPYIVSGVGLHCNDMALFPKAPFSTQAFTAAEFTYVAADFTLNAQPAVRVISQGKTVWYRLDLTLLGAFEGIVNVSATSLPPDARGVLGISSLRNSGPYPFKVTTATTTPTGVYSIPVGYSSGGVAKTLNLTLTVTSADVTIGIDPQDTGTLHAGQRQQFHATVPNTSNNAVVWSLSSPIGTIDATGLYIAPSPVPAPTKIFVRATTVVDPTIYQDLLVTLMP